jgi:hypothetical protein
MLFNRNEYDLVAGTAACNVLGSLVMKRWAKNQKATACSEATGGFKHFLIGSFSLDGSSLR